jgi:flagellar hook-associated protein 2
LLLKTAGIEGDRTEFENTLYDEIDDYTQEMSELSQKLYDKETNYYNKFAAMEKALQQMNQQSSWITSQFSQSSS